MSKRAHYIFYPSPIQEESKDTSKILSDLGRATKRGIKKCFKCGTYNGTRGLMCKNKQCDAVFKDCGEKQKTNLDAIKLVSGASRQVFSVRVRDKGPDCRGFVQLPLMQGSNEANEKNVALSEVALCFVDSCQRLFDDSILKCHEAEQSKVSCICIHIKSALKSVNIATSIETKSCILNSLNFDEDVKHKLWLLSTKSEGALVQRVSKTVMAVKCQVTPKHPLGYLHFTFCVIKGKETYDKFVCSCLNFKGHICLNDNLALLNQKCIHFYACIWAFASDLKFTEEFIDFLNLVLCTDNNFQASLNNPVLKNSIESNSKRYSNLVTDLKKSKTHSDAKANKWAVICKNSSDREIRLHKIHKKYRIEPNIAIAKKQKTASFYNVQTSLSFTDWLTSAIERINQTLCRHNGCVEALTFYIPLNFFQLLENKLHSSGKQLNYACVTNGTKGISYLIYSISHLKELFHTPQMPLQIMKLFVQNEQGMVISTVSHEHQESLCQSHDAENEYKQFVTFLKVGSLKNEDVCLPFTLTWDSRVLPISNFGKLDLTYHVGCCDSVKFNEGFL